FARATTEPERWPLLAVDGEAVVVGVGPVSPGRRLDPAQLAFGSQGEEDDSPLPPAPESFPGELPAQRSWGQSFLHPPTGSAWERDAAAVYLRLFEENRPRWARRQERRTRSRQAAGLVGVVALPCSPAATATLVASRLGLGRIFLP